jgi:hypothetical protein
MKLRALFAVSLCLAGCQTKQLAEMNYSERRDLAVEITKRCYAQGVKPNSPQMKICTDAEIQSENYKRQHAMQIHFNPGGAATALQGVSQNYYNAAAATSANRTVTCHSNPAPTGMSSVSCY